jgi:hypothetical protein
MRGIGTSVTERVETEANTRIAPKARIPGRRIRVYVDRESSYSRAAGTQLINL